MAVRLPSDLVADVMRNADPVRQGAALARLQATGSASATDFSNVIDDTQASSVISPNRQRPTSTILTASPGSPRKVQDGAAAYLGFERMVLRNLFETLLPNEGSGAFGAGPSAGVWRSMAADQLAGVYAENGGIGIQSMLSTASGNEGPHHEAEWPYFSMGDIGGIRG